MWEELGQRVTMSKIIVKNSQSVNKIFYFNRVRLS